jgi:TatD DNase family protein
MLDSDPRSSEASWREVGKRTIEEGTWFVNVGADLESSKLAIEQAEYFAGCCFPDEAITKMGATVGLHPTEDVKEGDFEKIAELARDDKVVAIGECGLEYYRIDNEELRQKQRELFVKHIELALEVGKPLMIHCRANEDGDAYEDVLNILKSYRDKVGERLKFNMHFFTGTWETAKKFIELGGYLSFPGVITFTHQYDEIVKKAPLGRIMSETDAPFATPEPFRGKRNEPAYVEYVAKRICELRPEPQEAVYSALVQNAYDFFDISEKS